MFSGAGMGCGKPRMAGGSGEKIRKGEPDRSLRILQGISIRCRWLGEVGSGKLNRSGLFFLRPADVADFCG